MHRVLLEYLIELRNFPDDEADKLRRDIFEECQEVLAEMVHTKYGSRLVREFIAYGNAKVCHCLPLASIPCND